MVLHSLPLSAIYLSDGQMVWEIEKPKEMRLMGVPIESGIYRRIEYAKPWVA